MGPLYEATINVTNLKQNTPYMKHTITKLEEENESANSVLGNYLMDLELRHLTLEEDNNIIDTHPDLLQCSRVDGIDCKLVDVISVSKIAELDNG